MKLRDFPLKPGGDADIPDQFRGNQEMAILELCARVGGVPQQYVAMADGKMTDADHRSEATIRREFDAMSRFKGIQGEVRAVIRLRGISYNACNYINSAMHIVVGPTEKGLSIVPVQMNVCRETFLNLLRNGCRRHPSK